MAKVMLRESNGEIIGLQEEIRQRAVINAKPINAAGIFRKI